MAMSFSVLASGFAPASLRRQGAPKTAKKTIVAPRSQASDLTGVVFETMGGEEAKSQLATVQKTNEASESLARVNFAPACEAALNEQCNVEYNVSYIYHAMYNYFNRDNVALPGFAKFFKESSKEERDHAELIMDYINMRGGRVKLLPITAPATEFYDEEKGDALHAMEMALALEKLNFQKLQALAKVADEHGDNQMCDFIEGELLAEQAEAVNTVSKYVSQLRRVGKGLGVYQFDKELQ